MGVQCREDVGEKIRDIPAQTKYVPKERFEPSEELGGQRPGEQFSLFLEGQCAELGFTHEDLRAWRPAAKRGKGKKAES